MDLITNTNCGSYVASKKYWSYNTMGRDAGEQEKDGSISPCPFKGATGAKVLFSYQYHGQFHGLARSI